MGTRVEGFIDFVFVNLLRVAFAVTVGAMLIFLYTILRGMVK